METHLFSVVSVVEDLARDWLQETFPTYFRCSWFSDFNCSTQKDDWKPLFEENVATIQ